MDAIVVEELRKRYKDVQALDGVSFSGRARARSSGCSARTAPASRRPCDPRDADPARLGRRDRRRRRRPAEARTASAARSAYVAQKSGFDWEATGRENLLLQGRDLRHGGPGAPRARRRAARARRPDRRSAATASRRLLRRDEAPARHRDRARCTGPRSSSSTSRRPGSIPRRASHVGGDRAARRARRA